MSAMYPPQKMPLPLLVRLFLLSLYVNLASFLFYMANYVAVYIIPGRRSIFPAENSISTLLIIVCILILFKSIRSIHLRLPTAPALAMRVSAALLLTTMAVWGYFLFHPYIFPHLDMLTTISVINSFNFIPIFLAFTLYWRYSQSVRHCFNTDGSTPVLFSDSGRNIIMIGAIYIIVFASFSTLRCQLIMSASDLFTESFTTFSSLALAATALPILYFSLSTRHQEKNFYGDCFIYSIIVIAFATVISMLSSIDANDLKISITMFFVIVNDILITIFIPMLILSFYKLYLHSDRPGYTIYIIPIMSLILFDILFIAQNSFSPKITWQLVAACSAIIILA